MSIPKTFNTMKLSERAKSITESKTIMLASIVDSLRRQGKDVVDFSKGEPDFFTPDEVKNATKLALDNNMTGYSVVGGIDELRQAIAEKLKLKNNVPVEAENIAIANGAKQILYQVFQVLCEPGDEVLIPAPFWVTFPEQVKLAGAKPVFVATIKDQLDLEKIKSCITKKTKAIIINSPNNPTGAVYEKKTLEAVAELACKNDFYIISDESYETIIYDAAEHTSIASLDSEVLKRTITIQTFSKTYSMPGFRIGYMAAEQKIIKYINRLQGHLCGNVCTFGQYGALAALKLNESILKERLLSFQRRRNLVCELLHGYFDFVKPQGAFFIWPDVKNLLKDRWGSSMAMAQYILEEAHVALVPGEAFGVPGNLRISFSVSEENIKEGIKRICSLL
ncbi:pyridoxal phosphate-dependent aminotransferase [Candidatus Riflebacteria bacterium]